MEELIILLILLAGLLLYCRMYTTPQFTETFEDNITLTACPSDMKTFYLPDDNTGCCKGEVVGNRCIGSKQCTMTGNGTALIPNCSAYSLAYHDKKAQELCPPTLPLYFEDSAKKNMGCTSGPRKEDLSAPMNFTQPICRVYPTLEENLLSEDSCSTIKDRDEFPCFGKNCKKGIAKEGNIPVITVTFTDDSGLPRMTFTRKSITELLRRIGQKADLTRDVRIAEVAKAYYIDRTLTSKDVDVQR